MKKVGIVVLVLALGALAYFFSSARPTSPPAGDNQPAQNQEQISRQEPEPLDENDYLDESLNDLEAVR